MAPNKSFEWLVASPEGWWDAGLPIAASRAGATGLLNLCYELDEQRALAQCLRLQRLARGKHGVMIESRLGCVEQSVLEFLREHPVSTLVLVPACSLTEYRNNSEVLELLALARQCAERIGWVVTDTAEAEWAESHEIDFLVAKGSEAAGHVGEETSFVLVQRLQHTTRLPVYVWGGIGAATAAGCAVAGAAGVLMDWQFSLTRESSLSPKLKTLVTAMDGMENINIPVAEKGFRIFSRPGFSAAQELKLVAERLQQEDKFDWQVWNATIRTLMANEHENERLWLIGQDISLASGFEKYPTVARILRLLNESLTKILDESAVAKTLEPDNELARTLGTKYPLFQGPMTRVSDVPEFAAAVANGGALPFLAVAMMRGPQVREMLEKTRDLLPNRSWGVGLLGFLNRELRTEQMQVVEAIRPPFAIIAGGRPDQAAPLEAKGIKTYLHVASPRVLENFINEGARRFIFEGRECGGHVGPRSSFVLWETMLRVLCEFQLPEAELAKIQIVFAGGINDDLSGAIVATLAQPAVRRGIKVGLLLGTGYLFTEEIVATGAVLPRFQEVAIGTESTSLIETGPGHVIRCAPTNFVDFFYKEQRRYAAEGLPKDQISETLEHLTVGRLRIASKGLNRVQGEHAHQVELVSVDEEVQVRDGMYMIGQIAALRAQQCTISELHEQVCVGGTDRLRKLLPAMPRLIESPEPVPPPLDIAIIGMSCMLPGAMTLDEFWQNIVRNRDCVIEVPEHRFVIKDWFDANPKARDKVYSRWGGFVTEVEFNPLKFGIPPAAIPSIEPGQLLTLELVDRAMVDAGYRDDNPHKRRTSVIIGNSGGLADLGSKYIFRAWLPRYVKDADESLWSQLPEWTEDSFAGVLTNVLAGRVANRFDFGGSNYTVDAACGSSLAAVHLGCRELTDGLSDMVVVGGVDLDQNPFAFLAFSKTGALSPRGKSQAFDKTADGIAISEGLASLVLKRREDAERDGDRIYAIIRGTAAGSDGRSKGLTAPLLDGQLRTLRRAYTHAGINPATCGLFEAHGTGTAVGDVTECQSLGTLLREHGAAPRSVALGSVKSQIGHTKSTAGIAGLIKVALAAYNRILPPTLHVNEPNAKAGLQDGPLYVNSETRPWLRNQNPRRAGISAFGFGGTNFHAVVEEYTDAPVDTAAPPMGKEWPAELFVFIGNTPADLVKLAKTLSHQIEQASNHGGKFTVAELAHTVHQQMTRARGTLRAAIVAESIPQLRERLTALCGHIEASPALARAETNGSTRNHGSMLPNGVYYTDKPLATEGAIAGLFPGQGSQYPNMLRDLALYFAEVRSALETADAETAGQFEKPLSRLIFPPPSFTESEKKSAVAALKDTRITQPALGASAAALLELLQVFGLRPTMYAGHSYGELPALWAAGHYSTSDLHRLSCARGAAMLPGTEQGNDPGQMLAVQADREQVAKILNGCDDVWVANHNSPQQTVLSGTAEGIRRISERLKAANINVTPLVVSCGFHSPLMAEARLRFERDLLATNWQRGETTVYSNATAAIFPQDSETVKKLLAGQFVGELRFVEQVREMWKAGARVFVELGPSTVLSTFVQHILAGQSHAAIALQQRDQNGLVMLLNALGKLSAQGVPLEFERLYRGRELRVLDLNAPSTLVPPVPGSNVWIIDGGDTRPASQPVRSTQPAISWPSLLHSTSAVPLAPTPTVSVATFAVEEKPMSNNHPITSPANSFSSQQSADPAVEETSLLPVGVEQFDMYGQFQETMRQFLSVQQRVTEVFLQSGSGTTAAVTSAPAPIAYVTNPQYTATPPGYKPIAPSNPVQSATTAPPAIQTSAYEIDGAALAAASKQVELPPVTPAAAIPVAATPSVVMTTPSVASSSAAPTLDELNEMLILIASERTGYPADSLPLDANLEADLGIDSIKRMEIIGAFRKAVAPSMTEPPMEFMDQVTGARTLSAICDIVARLILPVTETVGALTPEVSAAPSAVPEHVGPQALSKQLEDPTTVLVQIAAQLTGYPADALGLDINLESELGIDSIKRVEIIASFRRAVLPDNILPTPEFLDEIATAKTLNAILTIYRNLLATPSTQSAAAIVNHAPPTGAVAAPTSSPQIAQPPRAARLVGKIIDCPLNSDLNLQIPAGAILITDDGNGLASEFARLIEQRGGAALVIPVTELCTRDQTVLLVSRLRTTHGQIGGIVHLRPLRPAAVFPDLDERLLSQVVDEELKTLLYLLQATTAECQSASRTDFFVMAAGQGGGDFATVGEQEGAHPWRGGLAGILKTAQVEYPHAMFRALDFDELPEAELLLRELSASGPVDIGYRQGRRLAIQAVCEELPEPSANSTTQLTENCVVLVTGGAQGITAEVALEFAQHTRATFVILGRSAMPEATEDPATSGLSDLVELRRALIEKNRRQNIDLPLKEIDALAQAILKARAMRRTLAAFQTCGATVEYIPCDVQNSPQLTEILREVRGKYGHIDALIHGAGVIEDRLIPDKTAHSFDRVFQTKVHSLLTMVRALQGERLKLVMLFGSVSGFFGNRGQVDYAAANEALNRIARRLHALWPAKSVVMNWGPWRDVGMVTAGVAEKLAAQGMELVSVADGRRAAWLEFVAEQTGAHGVRTLIGNGSWLKNTPQATGTTVDKLVTVPID